ncbi:hypothetical protein C8J56DRAFT_1058796 [Mycena floridula]|nr:hypothetical protein C8J56DRAFT_1058796 [Mycena floridula]
MPDNEHRALFAESQISAPQALIKTRSSMRFSFLYPPISKPLPAQIYSTTICSLFCLYQKMRKASDKNGSQKPKPKAATTGKGTKKKKDSDQPQVESDYGEEAKKKKDSDQPQVESDYGEEVFDNNVNEYWQTPPQKKPGRSLKASAPSQADAPFQADTTLSEPQLSKEYGLRREPNASKLATPAIVEAIKNRKDLPDPDLQELTPRGAQRLRQSQSHSNLVSSLRAQSLNPGRTGSPVSRSARRRSHSNLNLGSSSAASHTQPITAAEGQGRAVSRELAPLPSGFLQQETNLQPVISQQNFPQPSFLQQQQQHQSFSQFQQPAQNFQPSHQQQQQNFQQPPQNFQLSQQNYQQQQSFQQPQQNFQRQPSQQPQQGLVQQSVAPQAFNHQVASQPSGFSDQSFNLQNQSFNPQPGFTQQPTFISTQSLDGVNQNSSSRASFNQRPDFPQSSKLSAPLPTVSSKSATTSLSNAAAAESVAPAASGTSSALAASDNDDDNDDDDEADDGKPTGRRGRLSNAAKEEITAAVDKMEAEVARLTKKHGCTPEYIWRQMRSKSFGPKNWNRMQKMLKHSETEHMRWIDGYKPGMKLTASVASAAYANFMSTMGDEDGEEYLDLRAREDALDPEETRQSQHRTWKQGFCLLHRTVERLQTSVGMNVILMAVADTVEEDHSLAEYFISPRLSQLVQDFFLVSPWVFLSIMKGSLYNAVGKEIFLENMREFLAAADSVKSETSALSAGLVDEADKVVEKEVRHALIARAEKRKMNWPVNQVPWSDMIRHCIDDGFQIVNWPELVPLPGSKKKEDSKRGGFASVMGKTEKLRIRDALADEQYALDFVKVKPSQVLDLKNGIIPYLSFGPPPHDSKQERAQRLFYNKPDDYGGPPRRLLPAPTAAITKPAARRARSHAQTDKPSTAAPIKPKPRPAKKKSNNSAALSVLEDIDDMIDKASYDPGTSDEEEPDIVYSLKKLRTRPVKLERIDEYQEDVFSPGYIPSRKRPALDSLRSDHSAKRSREENSSISDAPASPAPASEFSAEIPSNLEAEADSNASLPPGTTHGSLAPATFSEPSNQTTSQAPSQPVQSQQGPVPAFNQQLIPNLDQQMSNQNQQPFSMSNQPQQQFPTTTCNVEPEPAAAILDFEPEPAAAIPDFEPEPAVPDEPEPAAAAATTVFDFEPKPEPAAAICDVEPGSEPAVQPAVLGFEPEPAAAVLNVEPAPAVLDVEPAPAVFDVEPTSANADVESEHEPEPDVWTAQPEPAAVFGIESAAVFDTASGSRVKPTAGPAVFRLQ